MMKSGIVVFPVALVRNSRSSLKDDVWGATVSAITLVESLPEECFDEIDTFSHVEVLFYFNKVADQEQTPTARYPRDNKNWPKVGIFAQRNKDRPNHIGSTMVRIIKRQGRSLFVQGLDAVNGTQILDIKPVMVEFLPGQPIIQPEWSHELMKHYWTA